MTGQFAIWAVAIAAGAALGAVYLALLWAGTRALARAKGGQSFAALALARFALVLAALAGALALGAGAATLLAALAGFIATRIAGVRLIRQSGRGAAWR